MRPTIERVLAAVAAVVMLAGAVAAPASSHQRHHHGPRLTLLFSVKAQRHPRAPGYAPAQFTCSLSDGGAYRICCSWNDLEGTYLGSTPAGMPVFTGAWDCTGEAVRL